MLFYFISFLGFHFPVTCGWTPWLFPFPSSSEQSSKSMGCAHLGSRMCSSLCRTETAGLCCASALNCLRKLKLLSTVALQEHCLAHLGTSVLSMDTFLGRYPKRWSHRTGFKCSEYWHIGIQICSFPRAVPESSARSPGVPGASVSWSWLVCADHQDGFSNSAFYVHFPEAHLSSTCFRSLPALQCSSLWCKCLTVWATSCLMSLRDCLTVDDKLLGSRPH